jgi:GMP synthase (glutamine-hydrolysing)
MLEKIIILDFGSQYTQLIARRVRELNVYCEIHPFNNIPEITSDVKGIILSGSPYSVRQEDAPQIDLKQFHGNYPVLAVCYGAQYFAQQMGGEVQASSTREYGRANLNFVAQGNKLFNSIALDSQVWMSHGDTITQIPENFELIASTDNVRVAAFQIKDSDTYAIQFHPEVTHSIDGKQLLENFLVDICGCNQEWTPYAFVETTIADLKQTLGDDKVVLALSGGVDSSVAAILLHKAIGKNLHCIFVDNGLLRKDEFEAVLEQYKHLGLNIKGVDAKERFLSQLAGVSDPELKRKAIGRVFIEVFDDEAHQVQDVKWLAQGTIYLLNLTIT